ncbi:MAG: hypothetical protein ABR974_08845 [Bacteroidales bacterium]|jgi:hypothetical protein
MKTRKSKYFLMILAVCGFMYAGCNKESSPAGSLPTQQVQQAQNSDVQDAVADKNDQDVDNTLDQLQVSNYNATALKSGQILVSRVISVDHPDSTTFPKIITIVYNNFQDSTATESFVKNGEIDVNVSITGDNKQMVTRTMTFKNYSITTDSTTVTISGTRTVTRDAISYKFTGLTSLRTVITDNIAANLSYAITQTGVSDTLKFTRVVAKTRKSYLHYANTGGVTWQTIKFKNVLAQDTITWSGTVTGINEDGESYSKTVDASTPLTAIYYKGTPVLASGTLDLTITGTTTSSFTITYMEDPAHPHMTLVTVTNDQTSKTHSFDRRFSRKLTKWW